MVPLTGSYASYFGLTVDEGMKGSMFLPSIVFIGRNPLIYLFVRKYIVRTLGNKPSFYPLPPLSSLSQAFEWVERYSGPCVDVESTNSSKIAFAVPSPVAQKPTSIVFIVR